MSYKTKNQQIEELLERISILEQEKDQLYGKIFMLQARNRQLVEEIKKYRKR